MTILRGGYMKNHSLPLVNSVLDLVGKTPMVRLTRLLPLSRAEIVVKLETFNPGSSIKDRVCLAMIEAAEQEGLLKPGYAVVEPTSGNSGNGLAMVCAAKGYRLLVTMPDNVNLEHQLQMKHYGVQIVLTPARKGIQGALDRAKEIVSQNPNCFMPNQFVNAKSITVHRETTALEILETLKGQIDAFVIGVGTGGTLYGVGEILKKQFPHILIVGVETPKSPPISGEPHEFEKEGTGFIHPLFDSAIVDEVMECDEQKAFQISCRLAQEEGISAGMSAGAAVWAALQIAQRLGAGKRVVTLLPDAWERYLSIDSDTFKEKVWDIMI